MYNSGVAGNEKADAIAKTATRLNTEPSYSLLSPSGLAPYLKALCNLAWDEVLKKDSSAAPIREIISSTADFIQKPFLKGDDSRFTGFLTGHTKTNEYLHRMGHTSSPFCNSCPTHIDSVHHVVFTCSDYETQRDNFFPPIATILGKWPTNFSDLCHNLNTWTWTKKFLSACPKFDNNFSSQIQA